jgi:hypothetical protein
MSEPASVARFALPAAIGLALVACSTTPVVPTPAPLKAAVGASLNQCDALVSQFRFEKTVIDSAVTVAMGGLMLAGQPVAAHCLVKGQMHKRKGSDGRDYAIGFEMRLPQAWNGRFYYQGNGGLDGAVRPAEGALGGGPITGALAQGFAVISSDAGHTGAQTPYFGLEPQARLDYGYQAVVKLTPMAKALIASAYGKAPDRSYIGGCSNGGRHAMVAASRVGDQYDGYLIGAPGYRLPNAALAQLWGAQRWMPQATPGARDGACLTAPQKATLAEVQAGGKAGNGQPIYSAFPNDPGIAGANWATWKFVNSVALDPLSVGTIFTAPPAAPVNFASASIDALLPAISATNETYRESGVSLMGPPGHEKPDNLLPLRTRGAKMVLYHGVSDAIFSAEDTRQWVERVNHSQGGKANDFARYFPVPGMNHCSGGPATDQFDLLGPLVKWVEQGVAPQAVTASARGAGNAGGVNAELPTDWSANRTRPLCAYPSVAHYNGSGSVESASSFTCR